MTLIAIIVILFLVSVIAVVWKTEQLNVDPLQDNLHMLVSQLISDGNTPEARQKFSELATAYFHHFHMENLPTHKLRVRLLHALSLLVHTVPEAEFKATERYLYRWEMPPYRSEPRPPPSPVASKLSGPADIFVSYAREDQRSARMIVAQLTSAGFSVWWDDGIYAGTQWDEEINSRLLASKVVVVLWSPFSSASEWVRREATHAKEHQKIVPIFVRRCQLPSGFSDIQTLDLSRWEGDPASFEWQRLIAAAARLSGTELPRNSAV